MPKIEFMARAFGKATKAALLNWRGFLATVERVHASGKSESFVYGAKCGFVRVVVEPWPTRKSEKVCEPKEPK